MTESADLNALAQQYGISVGKASLIQEVIAQDSTLTFASLAPLSVNEIALIAESRHLTTQAVTQTGTASTKAYITAEEAKNAALAHAGIAESSVAQLEIEFDSEDGLDGLRGGVLCRRHRYDYDINARTGEVVNFSRRAASPAEQPAAPAPTSARRPPLPPPDPRRRQRSGHHLSPLLGGARRRSGGVLRGGVPGGHHGVSV
ncbi:MAG: PepSY domain-containing protein [Oscillibacter sp.]